MERAEAILKVQRSQGNNFGTPGKENKFEDCNIEGRHQERRGTWKSKLFFLSMFLLFIFLFFL